MKLLKRKGFTLIELVIGLALMSIVLLVITSFFLNNNNTMNRTHIKAELQSEGEYIMSFISRSLMEGKAVKEVKFDGKGRFQFIEISSYKEELNRGFYLNGKTLSYKVNGGEERIIGENVQEIIVPDFTKKIGETNSLEIEIVLSKKDIVYKLKDNIFFRNSE